MSEVLFQSKCAECGEMGDLLDSTSDVQDLFEVHAFTAHQADPGRINYELVMAHHVPLESLRDKGYALSAEDVILMVVGQRGVGFGLGFIPLGREGRKEYQGPMVPGPWGYAYGLPMVLSGDGHGSAWERDEARKAGRLIEAREGDLLIVGDDHYRISFLPRRRNEYVELTLVQA